MERNKYYDIIVIGAGAGGLFFGAACSDFKRVLILEKTKKAGTKLLMSGSGQCNVTHGGSIKEFLSCYGSNGKKIRSCLYKHNNIELCRFLSELGVESYEREDGKIFPLSMEAEEVRSALLAACAKNGVEIRYGSAVTEIEAVPTCISELGVDSPAALSCGSPSRSVGMVIDGSADHAVSDTPSEASAGVSDGTPYTDFKGVPTDRLRYLVRTGSGEVFACRHLVVAAGGASYPTTGSDGSLLEALTRDLPELAVVPLRPALVPVFVEGYPFAELSGISFRNVQIKIYPNSKFTGSPLDLPSPVGDLLLTHKNLSGPVILNNSRYLQNGFGLEINFVFPYNDIDMLSQLKADFSQNRRILSAYIAEKYTLPKKFTAAVLKLADISDKPAAQLSGKEISRICDAFAKMRFSASGTAGYRQAMATAGGISLDDINTAEMQSKKYPGLYFIGEVSDIDGDTGGYNLQFAYSSARAVIDSISKAF